MTGAPAEDELIAFADERLDAARAAEVAAWLAERPEEDRRVRDWRRQTTLLKAALDPVADEPLPDGLRDGLYRRRQRWMPIAAAAMFAGLLAFPLGAFVGPLLWPDGGGNGSLTRTAETGVATHRLYMTEVRHPVEVAGDDQPHLDNWLSRRTQVRVKAPDLSGEGLRLLGGRLVRGDSAPAALLMYEGNSGERYTLFFEKSRTGRSSAFRYVARDNTGALYWVEGECVYVLSGPTQRSRLERVATAVYNALEE